MNFQAKPMDRLFHKQLELLGSVGYAPRTWDRVMSIFAYGKVRLNDLVSGVLPLAQWQEGFDACATRRGLKVLIAPENGAATY